MKQVHETSNNPPKLIRIGDNEWQIRYYQRGSNPLF